MNFPLFSWLNQHLGSSLCPERGCLGSSSPLCPLAGPDGQKQGTALQHRFNSAVRPLPFPPCCSSTPSTSLISLPGLFPSFSIPSTFLPPSLPVHPPHIPTQQRVKDFGLPQQDHRSSP